jgi:hypothetical protein
MKRFLPLFPLFLLTACNDLVKNEKLPASSLNEKASNKKKNENLSTGNSSDRREEPATNSDADILNNIELYESGGLKVAQAYLTFEDGKLVSKLNETALRTPVLLNLIIDEGWAVKEGQSSIDATEIITTHDGEIVLNAPNLFKSKPTINAADANHVLLKANITKTRPNINYFIVNYRVWDKWSDAEVKGSYKLYVTE